jgi:hypothetical protein
MIDRRQIRRDRELTPAPRSARAQQCSGLRVCSWKFL